MFSSDLKHEYYTALINKNPEYEGVFFVGVKTTNVLCRPTCPARKPKLENCEFFSTAELALLSGFRPCKRCKPLSAPSNGSSEVISKLIEAIENDPAKKWKNQDFKELGFDESTARRNFKKKYGMTFVEYARSRRMGIALQSIKNGSSIIEAQLDTGYDSSSGFRDAFSRIMGFPPSAKRPSYKILKAKWIDTVLGPMIAIADDTHLYLLEFIDRRGLENEVEKLRLRHKAKVIPGTNDILTLTENELTQYYNGERKVFSIPLNLVGSEFQKKVWLALLETPYGQTRSYAEVAAIIGNSRAYRAVARANGANQLAIVVPCHRIINSNGDLGGYGGKTVRKKFLIDLETKYS